MTETNNTNVPAWTVVAIIGGLLAFIGLFLDVLSAGFKANGADYTEGISGIDMMSDDTLTFAKMLPLLIAILGIALAIYAVIVLIMKTQNKSIPASKIVIPIIAGLMLLLMLILSITVGNKSIVNIEGASAQEATAGLEAISITYGAGGWLLIAGSILAGVSLLLVFFEENIKEMPKWALVSFIGGVIAFFGLSMEIVQAEFSVPDTEISMSMFYSGGFMLDTQLFVFTFVKALPLIIAILGLALAIFSMVALIMKSNGKTIQQAKVVTLAISIVMLVLTVVLLAMIYSNNIVDFNAGIFEDIPSGLNPKDYVTTSGLIGLWVLLAGSIVGVVGGGLCVKEGKETPAPAPVENTEL